MFVAMNRITVNEGRGPDLERAFADRNKYVEGTPGFIAFHVLRPEKGNTYISMSMWENRSDFEAWMRSPNFAASHQHHMEGVVAGRPQVETYVSLD